MAAVEYILTGLFNDASLVAYWRFESNLTDSSPSGYNLTDSGSDDDASGKFGHGRGFVRASSDYATISNASGPNLNMTGSQTWSMWFKPVANNVEYFVMGIRASGGGNTHLIYSTGAPAMNFTLSGLSTDVNSSAGPTAGAWNHVVGRYNSSDNTLAIFLNGTKTSVSVTGSPASVAQDFSVGRAGAQSTSYTNGSLDDVAIFSRALTDAEILMLYQGGIAFDAASNSGYQATASTYNWSHVTLANGDSRYLIVGVSMLSVIGSSVSSITYNSVGMSFLGAISSVSGAVRSELWGLLAPSTGSNSIAVTLSTGLISAACAISFTGVHQTSPIEGINSATATNVGAADATVNVVTVATNDWVVDQVSTDDTAITVGAGQTSRNNVTGAGGSGADSTEPATTAATITMSWTNVGALATWSTVATALRDINASSLASTARLRSLLGVGL